MRHRGKILGPLDIQAVPPVVIERTMQTGKIGRGFALHGRANETRRIPNEEILVPSIHTPFPSSRQERTVGTSSPESNYFQRPQKRATLTARQSFKRAKIPRTISLSQDFLNRKPKLLVRLQALVAFKKVYSFGEA